MDTVSQPCLPKNMIFLKCIQLIYSSREGTGFYWRDLCNAPWEEKYANDLSSRRKKSLSSATYRQLSHQYLTHIRALKRDYPAVYWWGVRTPKQMPSDRSLVWLICCPWNNCMDWRLLEMRCRNIFLGIISRPQIAGLLLIKSNDLTLLWQYR